MIKRIVSFVNVCKINFTTSYGIFKFKILIYRYSKNEAVHYYNLEDMKWGWGDVDMKPEEIQGVNIYNKSD